MTGRIWTTVPDDLTNDERRDTDGMMQCQKCLGWGGAQWVNRPRRLFPHVRGGDEDSPRKRICFG